MEIIYYLEVDYYIKIVDCKISYLQYVETMIRNEMVAYHGLKNMV